MGLEPNLQVGDVVLIQNENLPPACMGRLTDTHLGSDGFVRIITIEYNDNKLKEEVTVSVILRNSEYIGCNFSF